MNLVEAILLGLLQGLTEFLPISSSAHLRLAGPLLASGDPGAAFTAVVQIGTEAAVLLYFRRDLLRLAGAWFGSFRSGMRRPGPDARMGWLIVVGTVPIAVLGVLAKDAIEGALRNLYVTATMLSVFGVLLGLADRWGTRRRTLTELSWGDGILLGLAQALALVPGVSRSGGTITAGLLLGFGREACARYSFLLAVPAVLASGFYQLARHWREFATVAALPTAVATLTAFATGYAVIVVFLRVVSRHGYLGFVIYRVALGALVLAGLATGTMAAA